MASEVETLIGEVAAELERATRLHGKFNSAHEGYAVLLEEVEELWEIVRQKRNVRDPVAMRKECVQIAAMAMKFAMCFGCEVELGMT